jgi:ketosteroid isomerase-like protein
MRTILALGFLAATVSLARAADLPKELAPRYDGLIKSIQNCDMKAFDAFYSKDYVTIDPAGKKADRAQYMKDVAGLFKGAKSVKTKFTPTKVAKQGDAYAVDFDFTFAVQGKPGGNQAGHEVGTDYWKKVGGKWMEVKTVDKLFEVKPVAAKPKAPAHVKPTR